MTETAIPGRYLCRINVSPTRSQVKVSGRVSYGGELRLRVTRTSSDTGRETVRPTQTAYREDVDKEFLREWKLENPEAFESE